MSPTRLNCSLSRLRGQFVAYALSICGSADEAEDLVQDAIVRALAGRSVPAEDDDLRPWMFRVIRNLYYDRRRKLKVRAEYFADQKRLEGDGAGVEPDPLGSILVRQALADLSPKHREVLCLVDVLGLRYAEVAQVLDVAEGTVMSRISRARRAMLERLEQSNVKRLSRGRRGN